ncbi:hypothetical protein FQA39_LY12298 [Lamprigera yunnana]|nr:hypothetical protein FQA39_LY12298 [Lamprigera yunnana]
MAGNTLVLKRESLSLNAIGKPKTPGKFKDSSEGSSINCHQRIGSLLESEVNLKQMKPFTTSARNVLDNHGHPPALKKKKYAVEQHAFPNRNNINKHIVDKNTFETHRLKASLQNDMNENGGEFPIKVETSTY